MANQFLTLISYHCLWIVVIYNAMSINNFTMKVLAYLDVLFHQFNELQNFKMQFWISAALKLNKH